MNDGGAFARRLFDQLKLMRKQMLTKLRKLWPLWIIALAFVAAPLLSAFAYVVDPQVYAGGKIIPARSCQSGQNVCYARVTVNFNDPNIGNGVWFDTVEANVYILSIDAYVTTAFNAGTTNPLTIGATKTGSDFLAGSGGTSGTTFIPLGSTGIFHLTTAAGLGLAATANTTLQTALNGAVPMYVRYAQTGTAATTGQVTIVITWAKNNDQ